MFPENDITDPKLVNDRTWDSCVRALSFEPSAPLRNCVSTFCVPECSFEFSGVPFGSLVPTLSAILVACCSRVFGGKNFALEPHSEGALPLALATQMTAPFVHFPSRFQPSGCIEALLDAFGSRFCVAAESDLKSSKRAFLCPKSEPKNRANSRRGGALS